MVMKTLPVKHDLVIQQGGTFHPVFVWKPEGVPADLTNCTARMQIRPASGSNVVQLELTTENGGIMLNDPLGSINLYISAEDTAAIQWVIGYYDLEVVFPSYATPFVEKFLKGSIYVEKEFTRGN